MLSAGKPFGSATLSNTPFSSDVRNSNCSSSNLPTLKFFSAIQYLIIQKHIFCVFKILTVNHIGITREIRSLFDGRKTLTHIKVASRSCQVLCCIIYLKLSNASLELLQSRKQFTRQRTAGCFGNSSNEHNVRCVHPFG